eukprot:gene38887-4405_t
MPRSASGAPPAAPRRPTIVSRTDGCTADGTCDPAISRKVCGRGVCGAAAKSGLAPICPSPAAKAPIEVQKQAPEQKEKEEAKEEPKEDAKEEAKEEPKEAPKEEAKEAPKEEAKEAPKEELKEE